MKKIKQRTMPVNNLLSKNKSLFLPKQMELTGKRLGYGWSRRVIPHDLKDEAFDLSLRTATKWRNSTSRIFDYVASVGYAQIRMGMKEQKKDGEEYGSMNDLFSGNSFNVEFYIRDYLTEAGLKPNRTSAKRSIDDLINVQETSVSLQFSQDLYSFNLINSVKVIGSGLDAVVTVGMSASYFTSMEDMGKLRLQNLSKSIKISSLKSREFWKFLQSISQGVNSDGSSRETAKEFTLVAAMGHLDITNVKTAKLEVWRCLEELDLNYKLVEREGLYVYVNQDIGCFS